MANFEVEIEGKMRETSIYISLSFIVGTILHSVLKFENHSFLCFCLIGAIELLIIALYINRRRIGRRLYNALIISATLSAFFMLGLNNCQKVSSQQNRDNAICIEQSTLASRTKKSICIYIDRIFTHSNSSAIVKALLIGDKSGLTYQTKREFAKAGVSHTLALSGLHVGIIWSILTLTLNILLTPLINKKWRVYLTITIIACYAILTGGSPSVVRATLMIALWQITKLYHRNKLSLNILLISAALILAASPEMISNISFQLSFSAVVGIILFYPSIKESIESLWGTKRSGWITKICKYSLSILGVSVACQITTLPFTIYYFKSLTNHFLLSNLIVIPMTTVVVYTSIVAIITNSLPYIGHYIAMSCEYVIDIFLKSVEFLSI